MVEITKVKYRRTIIPDNKEPNMSIRTYENESFEFEAIPEGDETTNDVVDALEREVLKQHERLEEIRRLRRDSVDIEDELADIESKLKAVQDGDKDAMWDEKKLTKRKVELSELLGRLGK